MLYKSFDVFGSDLTGADPAQKPRETGRAYPRLQVIRTVRMDSVTQLRKVTVTLVRLENFVHQSNLLDRGVLMDQWKMQEDS